MQTRDLKVALLYTPRRGMSVPDMSPPVRVTHVPTGTAVTVRATNTHLSRNIAIEMIEWALLYENKLLEAE